MSIELAGRYADARKTSRILLWLLWISVAIMPVVLTLDLFEYSVLGGIKDLSFSSNEEMVRQAEASDRNQAISGIVQLVIFLVSLIWFFMWVFKSNKLARALGAEGMQYSPGWSVGWFFVPIANIFKPYFALKEIYLATIRPKGFDMKADVEGQPDSLNLLKLWWFIGLADGVIGNIATRHYVKAEGIDQLITANKLIIASDCFSVVSALLTIWLVREYSRCQRESFESRGRDVPVDFSSHQIAVAEA